MPEQVKKSLSALEWQCGRFDLALWLGSLGRLSLCPGLWCWRDLHAELAVRAPESAAHAATRFLATRRLGAAAFESSAAWPPRDRTAHDGARRPHGAARAPRRARRRRGLVVFGPTARLQARITAALAFSSRPQRPLSGGSLALS